MGDKQTCPTCDKQFNGWMLTCLFCGEPMLVIEVEPSARRPSSPHVKRDGVIHQARCARCNVIVPLNG